jgi:hypothetical protein
MFRNFFRMYAGMFASPALQFPGKQLPPSEEDLLQFPGIIQRGDIVASRVIAKGTVYRPGQVVVTQVHSQDVLEVGDIQRIVVRGGKLYLLVTLHDAARNNFRYFESLPSLKVKLVAYNKLSDYKPLVKRGKNICFPFVLHHHIPSPP